MSRVEHDSRIVDYLLGKLSDAEQERLEQEFLSDDSRYEDVLAVEDELLLEYARGELVPADRTRVEERLLRTDKDRERLAWARALVAWFDAPGHATPRLSRVPLKYLLPIAALIAIGFTTLIAQNLSLRRQLEQAESARAAAAQALEVAQTTPVPQSPPSAAPEPAIVVSLSLTSGLLRSTGALPRLSVPPAATAVRLELERPAGVTNQQLVAALRDVDGRALWTGPASSLGRTITVEIPASRFMTGDYELVLRDRGQDHAEYYFSIVQ